MANNLGYEINDCDAGGVSCKASVWAFRINSTLKDVGLEFWYEDALDFTREDTSPSIDIDSEDIVNDGDPRTKQSVTAFTEGQDFSISEDCNSAFLQRLHEIWALIDDDEQRRRFLECGLDIKKTTYFGDASYTVEEWDGCGLTDFEPPYRKQEATDTTTDFSAIMQNKSSILNVGFTSELPSTLTAPTANITVDTSVVNTVTVNLQDIVDIDELIFNDTFNIAIYTAEGTLDSSVDYQSGDFPVDTIVTPGGEYTLVVSYLLYDDLSNNKVYKSLLVQDITVNQAIVPATGNIVSDGIPTATSIAGTYDYTENDDDINNARIDILDGVTVIESITPIIEGIGTSWASTVTLTTATVYDVNLIQGLGAGTILSTVQITTI